MKRNNGQAITRVVFTTGISSVVTQLLTIRELLTGFNGNEFVIALILFSWLALGGVGTRLAQRDAEKMKAGGWQPTVNRLCLISFLLIIFSVLQILGIRLLRDVVFTHGASVGFYPTFLYILITLVPYSLVLGFALPYSLLVLRAENPVYPGVKIYMTDNLGDMAGGALFSFVFVYLVTPLQALLIAGLPLFAATLLLLSPDDRRRSVFLLLAGISIATLLGGVFTEHYTLSPSEGKLVHYRESRYGRIEIHQDRDQFTVFVEGIPLFSNQNVAAAEEIVHYPLSQIDDPVNLLVISMESGVVEEIQKYHPETVDYVEIDPEVTAALFKYGFVEKKPWLNVIHQDGRAYLATTKKKYDAILVNLPEPETFQVNRFFTEEFFSLAKARLSPNGILSFTLEGFDNYLAEPQRQKLSSLYNTAKDFFPYVVLLPGQKIFFLCGDRPMNTDIPNQLFQKKIPTTYISGFYSGNVTEERIERLNGLIDRTTPKNHDRSPYLMKLMFSQWFLKFSTSPVLFFIILASVFAGYLSFSTREEFVLFSSGFTAMGSEILVIFAFQIFFGYIYLQIGLIVTVFLAGLLPGAWIGERIGNRINGAAALAATDGLLITLIGFFALVLLWGGEKFPTAFYMGIGFIISGVCGCQVSAALRLKDDTSRAATRFFSADLMGAALGTLVTSVVLIPYCGIIWATLGLIGLKLSSLIVFLGGNILQKKNQSG